MISLTKTLKEDHCGYYDCDGSGLPDFSVISFTDGSGLHLVRKTGIFGPYQVWQITEEQLSQIKDRLYDIAANKDPYSAWYMLVEEISKGKDFEIYRCDMNLMEWWPCEKYSIEARPKWEQTKV